MTTRQQLTICNFAQLARVDLSFGDLTVLVGAQGTGKSLALQWLKAANDGRQIVEALQAAGHPTSRPQVLVDLIFGAGMGEAWRDSSEVSFNGRKIVPANGITFVESALRDRHLTGIGAGRGQHGRGERPAARRPPRGRRR